MINWQHLTSSFREYTPLGYLKYVACSLILVIIFLWAEVQLFRFSMQFVIYESWASWYFPVGLKFVALFIFPFRYWSVVIIGGFLGQSLYKELYLDMSLGEGDYVNNVIRWTFSFHHLLALFIIAFVKVKLTIPTIEKLKPLFTILSAAILYRLITSTFIVLNSTGHYYGSIPQNRRFELILTHFLGGMVSILLFLSLGFLLKKSYQNRANIDWLEVLKGALQIGALLVVVMVLHSIQPHTIYLLKILVIFPLVWFAYRFAWVGAISISLIMSGLILGNVFGLNQTQVLIDNQLYIISYTLTGMLLGALMSEQNSIKQCLVEKNEALNKSNHELTALSNKNQALAHKIISIQEAERRKLSHELHDEVGQNITALKVELRILESSKGADADAQPFKHLKYAADKIYESVYRVMNWLRPRILDDLGLKESLTGIYFAQKLKQANIIYYCSITGDTSLLGDAQSITIFRVAQECVNNTIKYSQASELTLLLNIDEQRVTLTISDDGVGSQGNTNKRNHQGGFGLTGIEERVIALNGHFHIKREVGKFAVEISLPLSIAP
jgi:two-component system sensor histidine kinase UhpB